MKPAYIIKDNKIYEVISENEAVEVVINNGIAKTNDKNKVDYDKTKDFLYAFFEIRAKFSNLFEIEEDEEEIVEEIVEEKKQTKKEK